MKIGLTFLCNENQKMAIFQFFLPLEKLIEVIFFLVPTKKYDIWVQLVKISSKSEKLLLHKILWHFCQIEKKWKFAKLC